MTIPPLLSEKVHAGNIILSIKCHRAGNNHSLAANHYSNVLCYNAMQ